MDEYVKGQSLGRTIVLTHPGGEVDGVGELYSHTPSFTSGEEVLVFARKDSKNNLLVTGGPEGKCRIVKDEVTGQKMIQGKTPLAGFTGRVNKMVEEQQVR